MDKITGKNSNRKFKLGMHSYTLHLSGYGESWGFQSEGKTYAFEKAGSLIDLMDLAKRNISKCFISPLLTSTTIRARNTWQW
ncbi:hypothetical protein M5E89_12345 [Acidaminococcus intestini]|nr:hypothetical protein M5E89_12345 [Acidaminococcus intestini]